MKRGLLLALGQRAAPNARRFALGFGLFYLALGIAGWFWTNPFGLLPLGPGDNLFHMAVGLLTATFGKIYPKER